MMTPPVEESAVTYLADDRALPHLPHRSARFAALLSLILAPGALGCVGLDAGVDYPSDLPDPDPQLATPEGEADPSVSLNGFVIKDDVCKGIDTHPVTQKLTPEDFARYLETL